MTNLKPLKRALLSSVLSIVLCVSMLLGTTFAWFTDSVTSTSNTITTGTLDIDLYEHVSETEKREITNEANPLFAGDILWEPGRTEVRYLSLTNEGTLALKYKVVIDVETKNDTNYSLTDVMYYQIIPGAEYGSVTAWDYDDENAVEKGRNEAQFKSDEKVVDMTLLPGQTHYFALAVHMDEEADNNYQGNFEDPNAAKKITFDITVLAGQLSYESDSFGNGFDVYAAYPGVAYSAPIKQGETAVELRLTSETTKAKVASVVVPAAAIADPTLPLESKIVESDYKANISIASGISTVAYDITVSNIKADNTTPMDVEVRIEKGLDPATVAVYHYTQEIPCTYDPNTGYVTFKTTGFSPFTIAFDADSEYVAPKVDIEDETAYPKAKVEAYTIPSTITWGSYGQWSPTAGLEANLESAYVFECAQTLAEAKNSPYANWYCDFYVKLDRDLGQNQIFLGGNYGTFGWVGFHNGSVTLKANEEIGLLKSVTTNPWTYVDVVSNVGTFICGVGDVNNALSGATFTVMLRLTNPNNANEYVNIETINYTFA